MKTSQTKSLKSTTHDTGLSEWEQTQKCTAHREFYFRRFKRSPLIML